MFDDHAPQGASGGVPNNLPIGEPGDMFAAVDKVEETPITTPVTPAPVDPVAAQAPTQTTAPTQAPTQTPTQAPVPESPNSAVGVGVLTPKQPEVTSVVTPPIAAAVPQNFPTKGPGTAKILMMVFISIFGLAVVAGAVWFAYSSIISKQINNNAPVLSDLENNNIDASDVDLSGDIFATDNVNNNVDNNIETSTEDVEPEKTDDEKIDDALIFGQQIDTDGDGLDDVREADLGTDPKNWDSDGDNLSDGDEVIIWKTQPLNPDTDDDGYKDGEEITGGYNPVGPGRLFEPPIN